MRNLATLIVILALFGCAPKRASTSLLLFVDVSGSTNRSINGVSEKLQSQLAHQAFDIGRNIRRGETNLRIFRFASKVDEVFSSYPDDEEDFAQLLEHELAIDPTPGTNFPLMLEVAAATVRQCQTAHIRIVILSDGLDDFQGDAALQRRYRQAATSIANDRRVVSVLIWGVVDRSRGQLRDVLAPLGNRLTLQSNLEGIDHSAVSGGPE